MKRFILIVGFLCLVGVFTGSLHAQTILLTESFESPGSPGLPSGWTSSQNKSPGTNDWKDSTVAASSGTRVCYGINSTIQQTLTSPSIDLTGYTADSVIFYARRSGTYDAYNVLQISTDGGTNWTTIDSIPSSSISSSAFTRFQYKIPSSANNQSSVKFIYRNQGNGTGSGGTTRFDDFTVRGISSSLVDGAGTASLVNSDGGTLNGTTIFNTFASTSVTITVTGVSAGNLDKVNVTVPGTWSGYNSSNVSLGGAFSAKSNTGAGNNILIQSANLGTTPGTITITGLTSPNTAGAGMNGNDSWTVQTAKSGGTLTNIATLPVTYTIIPISNLRSGGTDGFGNSDAGGTTPVLNNNTVVVQGVITVPNGVLASTATTSVIIQNGNYGMQVFKSSTDSHLDLLQGNEIIVKGLVQVFNGNTEIVPSTLTSPDLFNLGAGSSPSPFVLSNASEISEANESRLVQINSVTWDSVGQVFAASGTSRGINNFNSGAGTAYINSANTDIIGRTIPSTSNIVGVVYHREDYSTGQQKRKIAPRTATDLGFAAITDGSGTASISPSSRASSLTAVAETLTVTGDGVNTLEGVKVTIPATWTWTNSTSAAISGAGFSGAIISVGGDGSGGNPYTITISGATVTNTNTGTLRIFDLNTPSSAGSTTFLVQTRVSSGTLTNITTSPTVNITAGANPFEAIASGNWNSGAVWYGGVAPGASDNVSFSTKNVVVTITDGAQCNNLTMSAADTTSGGVGAILQFPASGTTTLTINGRLDISGSIGRPQLTSNGNSSAILVCKGYVFSSVSNTIANGNKGLNMNEGTVKLTGSTSDSLRTGAGLRLGNLIVGDGTNTKSVTWVQTSSATLAIRSLTVKTNATFVLGGTTYSITNSIGNFSTSGIPMLTGGVTVESGGNITVNNASATSSGFINIKDGGFTAPGSIDLRSADQSRKYSISFGDLTADPTGSNQTLSAYGPFPYVKIGALDTVTLLHDVYVYDSTVVNGLINETSGIFYGSYVKATRKVVSSQDQSFGGIGLVINDAGAGMDTTVISRGSWSLVNSLATKAGGSNYKLRRHFKIIPKVNTGLNAAFDFYYRDSELDGLDASTLTLWMSDDSGATWSLQGGTVNTGLHKITLTGVTSLPAISYWTASDATHPLDASGYLYAVDAGWNMVSVPLTLSDYTKTTVYPTATSNAFAYTGSYTTASTLSNGPGYWLKFGSNQNITMNGTIRSDDSVSVLTGWNMVGSISTPLPVSSITSVPGGLVTSSIFGYSNGYFQTDTIYPGKAYWVKSTADGKLYLANSPSAAGSKIRIVRTNEMPPPPPGAEVSSSVKEIPEQYGVSQNYPNPFNPVTNITYALPENQFVNLEVYNVLGEKVAVLVNGVKEAGIHTVAFEAISLPSGLYIYRLTAGNFSETKRMVLMK